MTNIRPATPAKNNPIRADVSKGFQSPSATEVPQWQVCHARRSPAPPVPFQGGSNPGLIRNIVSFNKAELIKYLIFDLPTED